MPMCPYCGSTDDAHVCSVPLRIQQFFDGQYEALREQLAEKDAQLSAAIGCLDTIEQRGMEYQLQDRWMDGLSHVIRTAHAFLADPANTEVAQRALRAMRAMRAMRVLKRVKEQHEKLLLSGTTKGPWEHALETLLADEPEASSRKHEGQHYNSSLDCSCCNMCGKPLAECEGR